MWKFILMIEFDYIWYYINQFFTILFNHAMEAIIFFYEILILFILNLIMLMTITGHYLYLDNAYNKAPTLNAKMRINTKGFDNITTSLFLTYAIFYAIYFIYKLIHSEQSAINQHNDFNTDSKAFLTKMTFHWIELYSIVIGFVNKNIPDITENSNYALNFTTYILLLIPVVIFGGSIAITRLHEDNNII